MLERLKSKTPLKCDAKAVIFAFVGGSATIFVLSMLTDMSALIFFMAPFGASCVLAFAVWDAPLAQPRNIIGGHIIASIIGLIILQLFGNHPWSLALGVGLAMACMVLTKTTHPPAGADPIIIISSNASWHFLLFPVLTGSIILTLLSIFLNRFVFRRDYPKFWL